MQRFLALSLLSLTLPAFSLETKPWFGEVYEFSFDTAFTYGRYRFVENALKQPSSPTNTYLLSLDLGFTGSETWDLQCETELARTPRQPFGWRSVALQGRYRWFDDVAGDPVSVVTGMNLRAVSPHSVRDVSSPYASYLNLEFTASLGKEWSRRGIWTLHTYGFASVGMANQGAAWTSEMLVATWNFSNTHRLTLLGLGYFGFGRREKVNIEDFHGWGKTSHQSIDVSLGYGYHLPLWGTLELFYAYRVFARNFPERLHSITLAYHLPFSLF